MFSNPEAILFSIIALCFPLFGLIMYFGLKSRKRDLEKWMQETNARLIRSQSSLKHLDNCSILYGNFYDSSPTVVGLKIKDRNDKEIGQANYDIGGTTIEVGLESYRVFNEGNFRFHKSVRPLKGRGTLEPPIAECFRRGAFRPLYQYLFPDLGTIEVLYRSFGQRAIIRRNGETIGEWFRLGPYELSGKALVLAVDLPLRVQTVLLAGPFTRGRGISY